MLSDFAHDARVWQVVQSILSELGADVTVALFEQGGPADYYDPPAAVCESMMSSDINVLVASTGMLHSPANFRAMEAGIPAICMDGGMTLKMFQSGCSDGRYEADRGPQALCGARGMYLGPGARVIPSIPTGSSTSTKTKTAKAEICITTCFPPANSTSLPSRAAANRKLVIDLTMHHLGRLWTPIELIVEQGRVVKINGGGERQILRDYPLCTETITHTCVPRRALWE